MNQLEQISEQIMAERWKKKYTRIVPYKAVKLLFFDVAVAQLCQVTLDVCSAEVFQVHLKI